MAILTRGKKDFIIPDKEKKQLEELGKIEPAQQKRETIQAQERNGSFLGELKSLIDMQDIETTREFNKKLLGEETSQPQVTPQEETIPEEEQLTPAFTPLTKAPQVFQNQEKPQLTPQIAPQQLEEKSLTDKISEMALQPSTYIANAITGAFGIEHKATAEEMVNSPIGKGIGLAIAGGVLALTWVVGGELLTAPTSRALIGKAVTKIGTLTKAIPNWAKVGGTGVIAYTPQKLRNDAKTSITSTKDTANLIEEKLKNGDISLADAYFEFDMVEDFQREQEQKFSMWGRINLLHYLGGGLDSQVDIANARKYTAYKRANLPLVQREGQLARAKAGL